MITVCLPSDAARAAVADVEPLPEQVRVVVWPADADPPEGVAETEFLLGGYMSAPDTAPRLAQLPKLRVVQLLSAGVDQWLPVLPDGVTLCNGRGVHGGSTAELAVTGILALTRRLPHFLTEQAAARWSPETTDDLDGTRVLLLGAGDISQRIARALEVFGAQATFVGHSAREGVHGIAELDTLLPQADVLAIALPLTDDTRRLVGAAQLAALPDGAIVANVARGAILDTDALVAELQRGRLRAVLDVTEPEPLPADHPLWRTPGTVITPHVGGGTHGWERRGYRLVREQIGRYLAGEPLHNVVGTAY